MREILFRGKRIDNGEWVKGDLIQIPLKKFCSIMEQTAVATNYKVLPETVGQYTGLTDKNGKKIWEGDIAKFDDVYSIELINGVYRVVDKQGFYSFSIHNYYSYLEVIGNIYDNPELLKGGAEE